MFEQTVKVTKIEQQDNKQVTSTLQAQPPSGWFYITVPWDLLIGSRWRLKLEQVEE